MSHARTVLIAAGLAFGVWETIDIFRIDVPAAAAIVAALFLSCTAWYWRRRSVRANVALLALFVLEVAEAPTWKNASTATKVGAEALGIAGAAAAAAALVGAYRARRSHGPQSAPARTSATRS